MMLLAVLTLLIADPAAERISGDSAFAAMRYDASVEHYTAAIAAQGEGADLCWRIARSLVCSGEVQEGEARISSMREAERYARRAVALDSLCPDGHIWLAGALGYLALDESVRRQVPIAQELHHEASLALSLRTNDDAALSILGSFYRALGNLGWLKRSIAGILYGRVPEGGYAEAESLLVRAEKAGQDIMRHPYELGVLYLDMGRKDEARKAFARAVQLPVRVAIDVPRLEAARRYVRQLSSGE
jgi:tetratricopeptide (TPR) repeat protein